MTHCQKALCEFDNLYGVARERRMVGVLQGTESEAERQAVVEHEAERARRMGEENYLRVMYKRCGIFPVTAITEVPAEATIHGIRVAQEFAYHPGHTWAYRDRQGRVRVGFDDFALRLIGSAQRVFLPHLGDRVTSGTPLLGVQSDRWATRLASPLSGRVAHINFELEEHPELLQEDPYGKGWAFMLTGADGYDQLIKDEGVEDWMQGEFDRLRQEVATTVGATALDAGELAPNMKRALGIVEWKKLLQSFHIRCEDI